MRYSVTLLNKNKIPRVKIVCFFQRLECFWERCRRRCTAIDPRRRRALERRNFLCHRKKKDPEREVSERMGGHNFDRLQNIFMENVAHVNLSYTYRTTKNKREKEREREREDEKKKGGGGGDKEETEEERRTRVVRERGRREAQQISARVLARSQAALGEHVSFSVCVCARLTHAPGLASTTASSSKIPRPAERTFEIFNYIYMIKMCEGFSHK